MYVKEGREDPVLEVDPAHEFVRTTVLACLNENVAREMAWEAVRDARLDPVSVLRFLCLG